MKQPTDKNLRLNVFNEYGDVILQFKFCQLVMSTIVGGFQVLACRLENGVTHELRTRSTIFIEELVTDELENK